MENFGIRLARLRKEKRLRRSDLAEVIGIDTETIARYERGEREPKLSDALTLADMLGVSLDYLAKGDEAQNKGDYFDGKDDICVLTTDIENAAISADTAKESVSVPRALVGKIDVNTPPFSLNITDDSMSSFGVKRGGYLIINPAERVDDFDIILVAYKSKTAIKRFQKMPDGAVRLLSPDGGDIDIPKEYIDDRNVFRIIGKAVLFQYSETIKLDHTF